MKNLDIETHIALAFDENFITPFYALLTSIFINNKRNKIVIHAIATGVTSQEKHKIAEFVKSREGEINFMKLTVPIN